MEDKTSIDYGIAEDQRSVLSSGIEDFLPVQHVCPVRVFEGIS